VLELDNLRITQDDFSLRADLVVPGGATTAILGPSGGGKSTLLLAVAGFVPITGNLRWQGRDLAALPPAARPVSMLFQEHNLFPHLSIARNVGLGIRPDLKLTKPERNAVAAALARVGLEGRGAVLPRQLSGGERQRVALARALLRQQPLWLLDEPFAALGPALRREMLLLLEDIRAEQRAAVLLVTHAPEDARCIAQSCIFVGNGRAAPPIDKDRFFAHPSPAFKAYAGL